jgi:integrase
MAFLTDVQELKSGLVLFRRTDVKHRNWYCRIKVPKEDRYKTISLKTSDLNEARDKAFDHDADIRFRVKHEVPIFEKSFEDVATEYSQYQRAMADIGQITKGRWQVIDGYIRLHLVPYMGGIQITHIGDDKWRNYPIWRKQNGRSMGGTPAKDGTVRQEMMTYRAVMNFAAQKRYIRESQVPKGRLISDKARRDEFTPQEYRHLHTFARSWVKTAKSDFNKWYRQMAYNFMLVMANTGMRTMEARNLRWRDVDIRTDRQNRKFVCINVRGKGKYRELVAASNVSDYLERIKSLSKATKPDDFVFTTHKGKGSTSLYGSLISDLLEASALLKSSSGSIRSTYCLRHTYATFRLMEGVDVYFLAKQMGTSVQMIEDHYGHITPTKNAERILQGIPGWEPIAPLGAEGSGGKSGSVNADADATEGPTPPKKK